MEYVQILDLSCTFSTFERERRNILYQNRRPILYFTVQFSLEKVNQDRVDIISFCKDKFTKELRLYLHNPLSVVRVKIEHLLLVG